MIRSYATELNDISRNFGIWWDLNERFKTTGLNVIDIIDHFDRANVTELDIHDRKSVKLTLERIYNLNPAFNGLGIEVSIFR